MNIYNYNDNVADAKTNVPAQMPVYPPSPDPRGRADIRLGDELIAAELAALRLEARSRSRGRSDAGIMEHPRQTSPGWYKWQLEQKEREIREAEQKRYWENQEQRWKTEADLKSAQEDAKRKKEQEEAAAERKRLIEDYERKKIDDAQKARDEEKRLRDKFEREEREGKEKAREEERRLKEKFEREEREAKEKADKEYKEFLRIQKEKKEAEERKNKEEKEKIDAAMMERLIKAGYSYQTAEAMLNPEKAKKEKKEHRRKEKDDDIVIITDENPVQHKTTTTIGLRPHRTPVFAKIHKRYLDIETLRDYRIPYEWDVVSCYVPDVTSPQNTDHLQANPEYIIVLQEMSDAETEALFAHTRSLRGRGLLEPRKKEKQFAWVRSRSKSTGRKDLRVLERRVS